MDEDVKGVVIATITIALVVFVLVGVSNWRWRLNKRDLIKAGYVQKVVPSGTTKIWVKDANSN